MKSVVAGGVRRGCSIGCNSCVLECAIIHRNYEIAARKVEVIRASISENASVAAAQSLRDAQARADRLRRECRNAIPWMKNSADGAGMLRAVG